MCVCVRVCKKPKLKLIKINETHTEKETEKETERDRDRERENIEKEAAGRWGGGWQPFVLLRIVWAATTGTTTRPGKVWNV